MEVCCKKYNGCGIFDLVFPHSCRGCGRLGEVLCERCKKYIITSKMEFKSAVACDFRDSLLGEMVEEYKYNSVRAMGKVLAEILDAKMPEISGEVVVVPLPTIAKHVRERGLDHTYQIGKNLARRRGWKCEKLLTRAKDTVQVRASRKERLAQAKEAYKIAGAVNNNKTYVLLDDVWTTGASMGAAEKLLREAGARKIVKAVLVVSR